MLNRDQVFLQLFEICGQGRERAIDFVNFSLRLPEGLLMLVTLVCHDVRDASLQLRLDLLLRLSKFKTKFLVRLYLDEQLLPLSRYFLLTGFQISFRKVHDPLSFCQAVNFVNFVFEELAHAGAVFF